ncbi:hypothetical protein [Psychrobacter sp. I-STPA10]|uniref:hypothetical protein n=1 Tax=Psychrobacter sp. I-STPA10 TaxID=2585769 RepID=UPI001E48A9BB|nr:hypothetical protein [Psychrobacter sp. I-STPA10]
MSTVLPQKFDWQSIFQLSFLPIYQVDPTSKNKWLTRGYDFVFEFPQATLVLLVHEEVLTSPTVEVKRSVLAKLKQKSVSELIKQHQRLYKLYPSRKKNVPYVKSDVTNTSQIYFVGISLLTVKHEQNIYPIPHQYGGLYFQEECVIDLDEDVNAIQVFSLHSLLRLTELLQTPSDFLSYLGFHRHIMSEQLPFDNEVELADTLMHSPEFFVQQTQLQQQLVTMGLLQQADTDLQYIMTNQVTAEPLQPLLDDMQKYSATWIQLVQGWVNNYKQVQQEVPLATLRLLMFPSTYMRMQFVDVLIRHNQSTEQQRQQGYICQPRFYTDFGCHYMMVIYGLDPQSEFSKAVIAKQFDTLLLDMNINLANTSTTDLILLGFDMTQKPTSDDFEVMMDVYHHRVSSET